tara:strand:+ start:205 stop:414 length:210 start_codon:yes stop_codon:yes gene_type:complete
MDKKELNYAFAYGAANSALTTMSNAICIEAGRRGMDLPDGFKEMVDEMTAKQSKWVHDKAAEHYDQFGD